MIVVFSLLLRLVGMDRSPSVWGRALLLGVLGTLVVRATMRSAKPPEDDASSRT